jgi:hypothetical protein
MSEKKRISEDWMTGWQKKIVADESIVWERKIFKTGDGYWIQYDGGKMLGKVSDKTKMLPHVIIEKNTWNHEHCSLCWETISEEMNFQHEGYTNGNNWLCVECYNKYIV